MALTADSPYMVENCKTLSVVAVVVDGLDLRGKIIGKHGMDPVFHSFLIVPAFEFQHIQSLFQLFHFFFHCGLALRTWACGPHKWKALPPPTRRTGGYFALAIYTFERSQILGGEMFVTITFSCIVGAAYHVKFGLAEYVFLQLGRDRTAKDMMLDLSSLKIFE